MPSKTVTCLQSNTDKNFSIESQFDQRRSLDILMKWSAARNEILAEMITKNVACLSDPALYNKLLLENNLEDAHWDWLTKSRFLNKDEYRWFYLIIDDSVQAVCVMRHPESSRMDQENIFYIDYIATAFWNRSRPDYQKRFSNLGTILISHCIKYAICVLKYRPGFCLHSLPTAVNFYLKLGMKDLSGAAEKENLKYFEAEESVSISLVERTFGKEARC